MNETLTVILDSVTLVTSAGLLTVLLYTFLDAYLYHLFAPNPSHQTYTIKIGEEIWWEAPLLLVLLPFLITYLLYILVRRRR